MTTSIVIDAPKIQAGKLSFQQSKSEFHSDFYEVSQGERLPGVGRRALCCQALSKIRWTAPKAAARLLALTMIADGHVSRSEVDAVRHHGAENSLGLPSGGLHVVLQTLCEDLLYSAQTAGSLTSCIDNAMLELLAHDVDDGELQAKVMAAIVSAAAADVHLADGEQQVLDTLQRCWNPGRKVAV